MKAFLSNISGMFGATKVISTVGARQGTCLAPLAYLVYVNGLLDKLSNNGIATYTYADNVTIAAKESGLLNKALDIVHDWGEEHGTKVNCYKSGIPPVVVDHRTKPKLPTAIHNVPIVKTYKYLGVAMTGTGTMKLTFKNSMALERQFKQKINWLAMDKPSIEISKPNQVAKLVNKS